MGQEKHKEEGFVKDKFATLKSIVVYNDDVNSFDHVIGCFINILKHDMEKAMISTFTVHNEGKCDVKSGTYEELEPFALSLMNQKLSCKIE